MTDPSVEVSDGPVTGLASEGIHVVRTPVGSVRRGVFFVPDPSMGFEGPVWVGGAFPLTQQITKSPSSHGARSASGGPHQ